MFPLRSHLSVATTALVLVVPVVLGVTIGGFIAGIVATATGFLAYDFVFIPPYYTLSVGALQNWAALGVYVVVTVMIAQVVARLDIARAEAGDRAAGARRLLDVSELLVRESSMPDLLVTIVTTVRQAFDLDGAALLLPVEERLELVASSGVPLSEVEVRHLSADYAVPVSLESGTVQRGVVQAIALVASGQAIGLLALRGLRGTSRDRDLVRLFANHLALALERTQLREQAVRAQLLEEVDRLRRSLVGAVSHDLRTPLATIKVSTSTLLDPEAPVSASEVTNLLRLIDTQADRLNRMVTNVLDMTRIQSGALELRRRPAAVEDLVNEAFSVLGSLPELSLVEWEAPDNLPLVDVDHVLICQVLANLIDNATRHAPDDTKVTVSAQCSQDGTVEVTVADRGPGVAADERATIFQMFNRREAGGRGGLGLAIAQAFVEAHGQRIWVDEGNEPGARFIFTLPAVATMKVD
jgi:two-component system sensor histidine kinase KdpD